jgi:hypothetical protein
MLGDCGTKCKYLRKGGDMWVNGVMGIVQHLVRSPAESGESVLRHQVVMERNILTLNKLDTNTSTIIQVKTLKVLGIRKLDAPRGVRISVSGLVCGRACIYIIPPQNITQLFFK